MSKLIDADKLIKEIKDLMNEESMELQRLAPHDYDPGVKPLCDAHRATYDAYSNILDLIEKM